MDRRITSFPLQLRAAQYLQVALSAALMWASFPEIDVWFLIFPSLALLLYTVSTVTPRRAAWYGFLWAMLFFVPHISWMNVATDQAFWPWMILCAAQGAFLALWGLLFSVIFRRWMWAQTWWGMAIAFATTWTAIEQLRARIPYGGFPWAKVAYSQVSGPLKGLAPLGGEALVTWWAAALASLLLAGVLSFRAAPWRGCLFISASAAAFFLPLVVPLPADAQNGSVRAGIIQGNVEIPMIEPYGRLGDVTGNHVAETERLLAQEEQPVEVIFWGEDAIDKDPNRNATTGEMIAEIVDEADVPLVAGYQQLESDHRFNWVSIWYPQTGQGTQMYGKQHPVPWGEYVPMRGLSEALAAQSALIAVDMHAVDNPGYLRVELADGRVLPIAIGICFEAGDEYIFAEGVRMGGEIIYVPTNNSQFQYSAESTQQLQMLQFRSIEFARAGIQVSTNGVSAVVSPNGTVLQETPKQVADYLVADLPLRTSLTPAAILGQWPPMLMMIVAFGWGIATLAAPLWSKYRRRQG